MRQQRKEALKSICSVSILKQVTRVRSLLGTCKLTHKLRFRKLPFASIHCYIVQVSRLRPAAD